MYFCQITQSSQQLSSLSTFTKYQHMILNLPLIVRKPLSKNVTPATTHRHSALPLSQHNEQGPSLARISTRSDTISCSLFVPPVLAQAPSWNLYHNAPTEVYCQEKVTNNLHEHDTTMMTMDILLSPVLRRIDHPQQQSTIPKHFFSTSHLRLFCLVR